MQTQTVLAVPTPVSMPALITPPTPPEPDGGTKQVPLILFGRDERGRPHGACFVGHEKAAVEHAADLTDLFFVAAETDALRDLGSKLPRGRLFPASGRAFVPFCSATLYELLLAAIGTIDVARPIKAASRAAEAGTSAGSGHGSGPGGAGAGGPAGKGSGAMSPSDWSDIKVGSLVLAKGDDEEGFYAATVVATRADDNVVLIWLGFDLPEFTRPRRALGLLHPEAAAGLA